MIKLYARHPHFTKSFLYAYCGRKDAIIGLRYGGNIVPTLMDAALMSDALVRGAKAVGKGTTSNGGESFVRCSRAEATVHAPAHGKLDQ